MTENTRPDSADDIQPPSSSSPAGAAEAAAPATPNAEAAAKPKAEPAPKAKAKPAAKAKTASKAASDKASEDSEAPAEEPMPETFKELGVPGPILTALDEMGWSQPTPVQVRCYAPLMRDEDVLVQSHTGSGKTGAFCLPWLAKNVEPKQIGRAHV